MASTETGAATTPRRPSAFDFLLLFVGLTAMYVWSLTFDPLLWAGSGVAMAVCGYWLGHRHLGGAT